MVKQEDITRRFSNLRSSVLSNLTFGSLWSVGVSAEAGLFLEMKRSPIGRVLEARSWTWAKSVMAEEE